MSRDRKRKAIERRRRANESLEPIRLRFDTLKKVKPLRQGTLEHWLRRQVIRPNATDLKMWHINLNSIKTSFNLLKEAIINTHPKPDIIGMCETLTPGHMRLPDLTGYAQFNTGARTGKRGTAFYVKEELGAQKLDTKVPTAMMHRDRITAIRIEDSVFIEVYAPVNSDKEEKRHNFYNSLSDYVREVQATLPNHRMYILGDFNAHLAGNVALATNENGHLLLDLCRDHGMFIILTQGPTWHRGTPDGAKSAVDYILTGHWNATTLI